VKFFGGSGRINNYDRRKNANEETTQEEALGKQGLSY
jgi:hypothetical protein